MSERLVTPQEYARLAKGPKGAGGPFDVIEPIRWQGQPVPPRRWIVENVIPEGAVTALYGNGGSGKSTLAMQLLIACALGEPWLGLPARPCRALGVFCEDDADELHRRTAAILGHYRADAGDLESLRLVSRVGMMNALVEYPDRWADGQETPLYSLVMNAALDFGAELVVLDSLHDLFPGDENNRQHARQFINTLRSIATEIRGGVLVVAHPSRSGMATGSGDGGSTGWHNTVRSRLYMRPADPDRDGPVEQVLEHPKANYGGKVRPIGLTWQDGAFVADQPATGMLAVIEKGRAERLFLACLDMVNGQERWVSVAPNGGNYAPKVFTRMPEAERTSKRELEAAMQRLFSDKAIKVESFGPPSRGWRRIVRAK